VVEGKIQFGLYGGKNGENFARENAETKTKNSGCTEIWIKLIMNVLSLS
jgi:hypothetical protein